MSKYHNIDTRTLKEWREDSRALMNHPAMPAETGNDPALPGRDWYKKNYEELCAEIEAREHDV